ncbi:MAG: hypothetical protein IKJ43_04885 [Bacilli bacterium]|nr:hypothetical protein [Bacilli bacterium]
MIQEIIEKMKNIKYGWKDKNENIHYNIDEAFSDDYVLETPEEVLKNNVGVCWDQVELERNLFEKNNINFNTYFIVNYDDNKCPTHTFLIYEDKNNYYWFEHSWERFRGIHKYKNEKEALIDITNKFIKYELKNQKDNLCLYKYTKPKYGINCFEFYKHCEQGKKIKFK